MSRRIVVSQLQATGSGGVDGYFDRVVKYIPGDVVALWLTVSGLISSAADVPKSQLLWGAFVLGAVFTLLWTKWRTDQQGSATAKTQIIVSTVAFGVWVFALGGPFADLAWYRPLYGSLVLIVCTVLFGRILPKE